MATRRSFIEGIDSYQTELQRWIADPPIRHMVGVHVLPREQFVLPLKEKLAIVGMPHLEPINYTTTVNRVEPEQRANGAGFCAAVRDQYKKIRPIVFVQKEIDLTLGEFADEIRAAFRLLILIHELGHAQDILERKNFNHDIPSVDLIGAELFAHRYVFRQCRTHGFYKLTYQYLKELKDQAGFACPVMSQSARAAVEDLPPEELQRYSQPGGVPPDFLMRIRKAGRWAEWERMARKNKAPPG